MFTHLSCLVCFDPCLDLVTLLRRQRSLLNAIDGGTFRLAQSLPVIVVLAFRQDAGDSTWRARRLWALTVPVSLGEYSLWMNLAFLWLGSPSVSGSLAGAEGRVATSASCWASCFEVDAEVGLGSLVGGKNCLQLELNELVHGSGIHSR